MLRVNSPEGKHLIYFFPIYSYNVFSIVSPFFIPIKRTHTDALLEIYKTYLQFVFPKKKKKSTPTYSKDLLQYYIYITQYGVSQEAPDELPTMCTCNYQFKQECFTWGVVLLWETKTPRTEMQATASTQARLLWSIIINI